MHKKPFSFVLAGAALAVCAFGPAAIAETPAPAAPVKATANPDADRAAYAMLKQAYDARQTLPANFAGFDADIIYQEGPRTVQGTFHFRSEGLSRLEIAGLDEEDHKWLLHNARSVSNHRREGDFNETEGKFPLSFGPVETGFGKQIRRNDPQNLSTRVRDGKILELVRTGGEQRFIISVLDTIECDRGKYVPSRYIVSYVDPKTEALLRVETFENKYAKVHGLWLPAERRVTSAGETAGKGLRQRTFQFKNIKILKG